MSYTYLALGDSYTIGEAVLLTESFPYQAVQLLRNENIEIAAPEIVARTGWTTGELQAAMDSYTFAKSYNLVTLLVGVNNQYRGYPVETYKRDFKHLLQQSIQLAQNNPEKVFVLSIPDYSVTPFAEDKNTLEIQKEIEALNEAAGIICKEQQVHFINITESTRRAKNNVNLLAPDGLHPSAAEYKNWAVQLARKWKNVLS